MQEENSEEARYSPDSLFEALKPELDEGVKPRVEETEQRTQVQPTEEHPESQELPDSAADNQADDGPTGEHVKSTLDVGATAEKLSEDEAHREFTRSSAKIAGLKSGQSSHCQCMLCANVLSAGLRGW